MPSRDPPKKPDAQPVDALLPPEPDKGPDKAKPASTPKPDPAPGDPKRPGKGKPDAAPEDALLPTKT